MAAKAVGNLLAGTPLPESAVRWAKGVAERAIAAWVSSDQSLCENAALGSHTHPGSEADQMTAAARRPLLQTQQPLGKPWHMTDDKKHL